MGLLYYLNVHEIPVPVTRNITNCKLQIFYQIKMTNIRYII